MGVLDDDEHPPIQMKARHVHSKEEYEIHSLSLHGSIVAVKLSATEIVNLRYKRQGKRSAQVDILIKTAKMKEFKPIKLTACQVTRARV